MQNLYGQCYKLCAIRLWTFSYLYQMWQEASRMPNMSSYSYSCSSYFPCLTADWQQAIVTDLLGNYEVTDAQENHEAFVYFLILFLTIGLPRHFVLLQKLYIKIEFNSFEADLPLLYPLRFLTFSGGIDMEHWAKMGQGNWDLTFWGKTHNGFFLLEILGTRR